MYDWLSDGLRDSSQIVTANRRLARALIAEFGKRQIALGQSAWRSPAIRSWQDWLGDLFAAAELSQSLPTRIDAYQSRVLWERCLRREVSDPLLNIAMLVRQARDSWSRLHDFAVPLTECEKFAQGRDQRLFARAARSYQSILDREEWVDEAGLAGLVTRLIRDGQVRLPAGVTCAGFDRLVPQATLLLDAVRASGTPAEVLARPLSQDAIGVHCYDNSDAELRAAGAWARQELQQSPDQAIAIVATDLEQNGERCARLIREGLAPGWQIAGARHRAAVNVSYGKKLSAYPAIGIALLALRWLLSDLPGRDVSALLRTSIIGGRDAGGRNRLELSLRQLPDRNWSPAMLAGALPDRDDAKDWLARLATIGTLRTQLPGRATPSEWVVLIDDALKKLNWPGDDSLGSFEFQLVNRWRELLNDLARLQLVNPTMTFADALGRLTTMASETVFQPETEGSIVQLLGPLEAAGMQFDQLWISGLSAAKWPPPGRPSPLLSRTLQRSFDMPDADPQDTLDYARRVLHRLGASAAHVKGSYPLTDGDVEQTESGLLLDIATRNEAGPEDPGWHAARLVSTANTVVVKKDRVPAVLDNESISGGAATINRQFVEPFSAFAFGRLGIRTVPGIMAGLAANLRGSLIHDALHSLYSDLPTQEEIASWSEAVLQDRIQSALRKTFARHEQFADPVLKHLLQLERQRDAQLLQRFVTLDKGRDAFSIELVEGSLDTAIFGVRIRLRIDRIDRLEDGEMVILDYKTGIRRQFLNSAGIPNDMQLVVYACAVQDSVGGLGLVNIDSRSIDIDGAGRTFTPDLDWQATLREWKNQVADAVSEIQRGDVRINGSQNTQASRPLSLLSRIAELRRDA
ncbi:MAG: PD-(D/E)XK nuclease family protein [Gammaproteobacteria bacterium]|nr:PD-(D/E)XK nuclease family protein [Gammaproteobacteria bacterium]MDH3804688.1 PD-(D/E)XK nuclease family protein [Gammaproteobacteria bacterium]